MPPECRYRRGSQIAEHQRAALLGDEFLESWVDPWCTRARLTRRSRSLFTFEDSIRTFRISTNTLGAGFVEAIANSTFLQIREIRPPAPLRGTVPRLPVLEAERGRRNRPFRFEEPARESRVLFRGRLPERDGDHQPAVPDGEHLDGRDVGLRPLPNRRTTGSTSSRSRTSCAARRRRRVARSTRMCSWARRIFEGIGSRDLPCHRVETAPTAPK